MPTISIVIPLYNKSRSIVRTLDSVFSQTYRDFEVIVVNDGSTDNSVDCVVQWAQEHTIGCSVLSSMDICGDDRTDVCAMVVVNKPNAGVCSARNVGIQMAKAQYIAFLDADDLWKPNYLDTQVQMIKSYPNAKMWGTHFVETNLDGTGVCYPTGLPTNYQGYVEDYFGMQNRISDLFHSSAVVIDKTVFEQVGYFDERIRYAEDNDMWFRIIATHQVAFCSDDLVSYMQDAENRAMNRNRNLRYFLPYFVDKYRQPIFRANRKFYIWINRWSAIHIRNYYFGTNSEEHMAAIEAVQKLDYRVIPRKYKWLFLSPYWLGTIVNKLDKWYHRYHIK